MYCCLFVDDDNDGLFYTSQDVEYIYFVHSLCLLGRVLLYSGGRALFPVLLPDREGNLIYQHCTYIIILPGTLALAQFSLGVM